MLIISENLKDTISIFHTNTFLNLNNANKAELVKKHTILTLVKTSEEWLMETEGDEEEAWRQRCNFLWQEMHDLQI